MRASVFALMALLTTAQGASAQEGITRLLETARSLNWPAHPGNAAYVLRKESSSPGPVALIFGYTDNKAACELMADILASQRELSCQSVTSAP